MAKKRTAKRNQPKFNWSLIVSLAVLLASYLFVSFLQGNDWFDIKAELSAWLGIPFDSAHVEPVQMDGNARVHFIDVGQGDCMLIENGEEFILIDAGENDKGGIVTDYLDSIGVEALDLAIGTHPHSDHIGGLDTVLEAIPAQEVLMPALPDELVPTTRTFTDLLDAVDLCGAELYAAEPGEVIDICGGTLEILGPLGDYEDLNDYSIVCRFTYGNISFLFTGDMEKKAENDLLDARVDVSADVLKMGHHGSSTSSGEAFIKAVGADHYVMTLGADNEYGHPHREVVNLLAELQKPYFRTDLNGDIVMTTDGNTISTKLEK